MTDSEAPLPITMTVDEVADQLRVSRRLVFNLIRKGELDSFKIGRSRRVPRVALATYIQHQQDAMEALGEDTEATL